MTVVVEHFQLSLRHYQARDAGRPPLRVGRRSKCELDRLANQVAVFALRNGRVVGFGLFSPRHAAEPSPPQLKPRSHSLGCPLDALKSQKMSAIVYE